MPLNSTRVQCRCLTCGTMFWRWPSQVGDYCSKSCSASRPLADRFWKYVTTGSSSEDWLWKRGTWGNGYGQVWGRLRFGDEPKMWLAHRVAFLLSADLPESGLARSVFICHRCNVRRCCNPAHLYAGDHTQNMADMVTHNRQIRGSRQHLSKLFEPEVLAIRTLFDQGLLDRRELAERYRVDLKTIWRITTRKTWAHVSDTGLQVEVASEIGKPS